jgi:hypothetical protein
MARWTNDPSWQTYQALWPKVSSAPRPAPPQQAQVNDSQKLAAIDAGFSRVIGRAAQRPGESSQFMGYPVSNFLNPAEMVNTIRAYLVARPQLAQEVANRAYSSVRGRNMSSAELQTAISGLGRTWSGLDDLQPRINAMFPAAAQPPATAAPPAFNLGAMPGMANAGASLIGHNGSALITINGSWYEINRASMVDPQGNLYNAAGRIIAAGYAIRNGMLVRKAGTLVAQGGGNIAAPETAIVAQGGGNLTVSGNSAGMVAGGVGNFTRGDLQGNLYDASGRIIAAGYAVVNGVLMNLTGTPLVAQGGGNLVAQGGGNLVAQGGGNLVAQGGGNLAQPGSAGYMRPTAITANTAGANNAPPPPPPAPQPQQVVFTEAQKLAAIDGAFQRVIGRSAQAGESSRFTMYPPGAFTEAAATANLVRGYLATTPQVAQEVANLAYRNVRGRNMSGAEMQTAMSGVGRTWTGLDTLQPQINTMFPAASATPPVLQPQPQGMSEAQKRAAIDSAFQRVIGRVAQPAESSLFLGTPGLAYADANSIANAIRGYVANSMALKQEVANLAYRNLRGRNMNGTELGTAVNAFGRTWTGLDDLQPKINTLFPVVAQAAPAAVAAVPPAGADDAVNAFVALSRSARAGYPGADAAMQFLASKLSPADLTRARAMSGR